MNKNVDKDLRLKLFNTIESLKESYKELCEVYDDISISFDDKLKDTIWKSSPFLDCLEDEYFKVSDWVDSIKSSFSE